MRNNKQVNKLQYFLLQYWWLGVIILLIGISWSWMFYIDVAKLSSNAAVGYAATTLGYVVIVTISAAIFYTTIIYLRKKHRTDSTLTTYWRIAGTWALAEFLVSWLVTLAWYGHNGSWDTVLPFSSFSLLIIRTPLKYLARFVGFYGLSGVVVATIWLLTARRKRAYVVGVLSGVIVITLLAWGLFRTPSSATSQVVMVANKLDRRPKKVDGSDSQLVVLPEYGLDQISSDASKEIISSNQSTHFVGTQQGSISGGVSNVLIFGSSADGYLRQYKKTRLIPGGEYLPFVGEVLLKTLDKTAYWNFLVQRAVIKGDQTIEPFAVDQDMTIGSGACSSIIAMRDYRLLTRSGATLLTNSASLDIFRGSRIFAWQQKGLASFMAVANARGFVQSANDADAYALDQNGKQLASVSPIGTRQVTLVNNRRTTPYTYIGEWVPWVGLAFIMLDTALWWHTKNQSES